MFKHQLNLLESKGNSSATSSNTKLVCWPLMGIASRGLSTLWPTQSPPCYSKCNSPPINSQCTDHCTATDGPLLCGFNVAIKKLKLLINELTAK